MPDFLRSKRNIYALLLLGALLGGLAINMTWWPPALVTLVPLFLAIYCAEGRKEAFLLGWFFGSIFMGGTLLWTFNTLPLDWLGITNPFAALATAAAVWSITALVLGLAPGLFGALARMVMQKNVADLIIIPLLWIVAAEYFRMWLFTLFLWGSGSVFEPYFSIGFIGYALAESPLALAAQFGGVYALSFITALLSTGIALFLLHAKTHRARWYVLPAVISFAVALAPVATYSNEVPEEFALVQINEPSRLEYDAAAAAQKQAALRGGVEKALRENPRAEVIILPEDARFINGLLRDDVDPKIYLRELAPERELMLVDSGRATLHGETYEEAYFYNSERGLIATQRKRLLLPFGEYAPYIGKGVALLLGQDEWLEKFEHNRGYSPGDASNDPVKVSDHALGTLLCSETLSPSLPGLFVENGATHIINLSSLSWFHGSAQPYGQLRAMAIVHAVGNQTPFIQVINGSPLFAIVPK